MRKTLTFVLLSVLLSLKIVAQTTPAIPAVANPTISVDERGRSRLELIVPTTGAQDALFLRGKDWVYRAYNSGKTVEQYADKEAGRIAVKARTSELTWNAGLGIIKNAGCFTYNLTLDFKEGKGRLVIDNITYKQGEVNAMILPSGADFGEEYPANWTTFAKKAMTKHWNEMQAAGARDLILLSTSFQAAMLKKSDGSDW